MTKNLYDAYAFDSPLEQENITADIEEVVVDGKIPRRSLVIPAITGGMNSSHFMGVIKRTNGDKALNIIVETKDVENKDTLRGEELIKIACAKIFFKTLAADDYTVYFRGQLNNKKMKQIIDSTKS